MEFTVEDPQGRSEVKTILNFKAVASAGTAAPGLLGFRIPTSRLLVTPHAPTGMT
jgi:hypothetical protein